ncbi:MAG: TonB-dependent receptor plug domain-containing protein [Flavobacteriia bacterium]|nr:TonB-dependent receptor plug domain-containing protein [Flavobacteriia bacterium]
MRIFITLFIISSLNIVFSQQNRTINGYISSSKNGEKLIGATLYDTIHKVGTVTNEYGFFSLTVPNELTILKVSYYGFEPFILEASITQNEYNISLKEITSLDEVVIKASDSKRSVESTNIGTMELALEKVDKLPVLMGEKDVLKILQLMPGVKSGGEGSSGIYVRGGGPDQNLILLDGVPVYNASHLFGFFSVFNSDALSQITLTKGGFPSRYGGRVSSVLDMRMKEGNNQKFNLEGSIGVIASRLLIEGPLKKNKGAFIISGRRTYIDALVKPFLPKEQKAGYYFYDLNAKLNYKLNNKHHLYLSGYFGQDKASSTMENSDGSMTNSFTDKMTSGINWGNAIGALRWNYRISPKLFTNTTFTYSSYLFKLFVEDEFTNIQNGESNYNKFSFLYFSGINDWTGKTDFTFLPNPNHIIKFGVGDIYHTFKPGVNTMSMTNNSDKTTQTTGSRYTYAHEVSIYFEDEHKITNRLKANYGLHHSSFFVGTKQYHQLQPRISTNYILTENSSLKFGYSRTAQFLHLLSNTGIGLPTDLWVPATERVAPITANQVSLGYNYEFKRIYNLTVEGYYKKMNHLIQYKEGSSFFSEDMDWQNKIEVGQGWAYGGEFMIEKRKGRLTGWIGYTLSWSMRQFDNINFGKIFPYRYDRRNDISIVATYKINDTWDVGAVFVYGTGNAVSLATQTYNLAPNTLMSNFYNSQISYFSSINNYRMPAYHRMDIGFNRTRQKKWGETVLSLSVYNVYNRQNAFYLFTEQKGSKIVLKQISIFPIIPSISWKFKFNFERIKTNKTITK